MLKALFNRRRGHGISILVPFLCPDETNQRAKNWAWLKKYWAAQLPGAEIIMGEDRVAMNDPSIPFSKSAAVNDAASKAKGDVFVVVDADGYVPPEALLHCADKIREAKKKQRKLWFVPYREFYRLTEKAATRVLESDPKKPHQFAKLEAGDIQNTQGSQHGHWYGAMVQIMPREAFEAVGGWDERFRGWGGEDHSAVQAMDTLYGRHKTAPFRVLHLWHPMLSTTQSAAWVEWKNRVWANQEKAGTNTKLAGRYYSAFGDAKRMRKLLDEGLKSGGEKRG